MKECTICHQKLDDSEFYTKVKIPYIDNACKKCRALQAHERYMGYRKNLIEKGSPKILHKKPVLLRKVCPICNIEKEIQEFPYSKVYDTYKKICKVCSYEQIKQTKPKKVSAFEQKRVLLAEGKQTCRICGQIKPIAEMLAGNGKYTGVCLACNKQQYRNKHGTDERLQQRGYNRQQKLERKQAYQKKQELFISGQRCCTKCGKILPLANFALKHTPPRVLKDYQAMCRKCGKQLYTRPYGNRYRLQKNMKDIINFINTDFTCELCGKIKAPYEMGITNGHLCWCKECQLSQKRKQYRRKNRNAKNNPYRHLVNHMRKCLKDSLVGRKGHKTFVYLGCTGPELKVWLESQFTEGMSWDNRSTDGWHIDHYVPISYFDLSKEEDRFICWNYRNLRPLWGAENVEKGNTLPADYLQHIEKIKKELHFPFDNLSGA
jgi:hypothetical protein